jgi:hypothetical protein
MNPKPHGGLTVGTVLICLALNPYRHLIRRWNWKTACLSACSRSIVILAVNLPSGGARAVSAMFAEACYRALTSGFYSALTQGFRFAQPCWAASAIPAVLIPLISDTLEFAVHRMHGTQRLGATVVASVIFTAASTFLELFAMRRGVLVMGRQRRSLLEDLGRVPKLIADFWGEGARFLLAARRAVRECASIGCRRMGEAMALLANRRPAAPEASDS